MVVQFTLDFAADGESDTYDTLIQTIRDRLAVGERIEGVPILAPQVPAGRDPDFFNVNLSYTDRGTTSTIQARFRTDNLYLVGFTPGAGAYQDLDGHENYNTLTQHADMRLEDIPLSSSHIGAAITTLAGGETRPGPRARALLTIIFAIAEAARFRDISSLISRSWWNASTPGAHYAERVRSWARLSSAVQRTRNEGHTFDFDGASTDIWAFVSAIQCLGIMHLVNTASRSKRSVDAMAAASYSAFARGQPLLEILYVRINSTGGTPGQLYGTVTVTDSARTHSIWERKKSNTIAVYPNDKIPLEGPSGRSMSAADEFYIQLDLWDHTSSSSDDSIAKGTIVFNPRDSFAVYDVVKVHDVTGDHGSVTVGYVAITDGLYAEITVVLIDGDGNNPAYVYGELTANNGHGQSDLFRKTRGQSVGVRPQYEVPLLKTVVAVPTTGFLNIHANLWEHDSSSGDDEIAYGTVEFSPLYRQSQKKAIMGANGKVEVRVTWM